MFKNVLLVSLTVLLSVGSLAILGTTQNVQAETATEVNYNNQLPAWTNTDIKAVVTVNNSQGAYLYDADGKIIPNRKLAPWSSWYTDIAREANEKSNVSNPVKKGTYYRVSTNEYIRGEDVVRPVYNQAR
ncbi:SLAP domain-containing protein [Companilactobacillus furfuricola]|uniref:SLAP domain-containing protein n=1 Tax=Companilactobacillus furfuricola TaxID=1462575 RepID=UPI0013DE5819|nr:hypothetical protein [Companilactobacillus furfuricola]